MSARPPPFFIVGSPRSGTTLLRSMLQRHPDLAIPPESHFIPILWRRRRRYGTEGRLARPDRLADDLVRDPRFRRWKLSRELLVEELGRLRGGTLPEGIEAIFDLYAARHGRIRWGDKTPRYVDDIALLGRLFPSARFVHLVRDGRDVALSVMELGRLHRHPASAAFLWSRQVRRGRSAGQGLGPGRYVELRYEDLLDDPKGRLTELSEFLGLSFDPVMLEHEAGAMERIPPELKWMHQRLALPPTKGLRDWRTDMSEADVADFEAVAARELRDFGYPLAGAPARPAAKARAWARVAAFGLRSLRGRLRRRAKRG